MPSRRREAAIAFIMVTVMLDVLALGIIIPVLPGLVRDFLGGDAARAAEIFGIFSTAWAMMQFVFSPIQGGISDRFGRRPVILISNFGLGLDYILMALAPTLGWLFVGRVISGICAASISTAGAYIADVTPAERRSERFGLVGAAFGFGFIIGPALGGLMAEFGPRAPFWLAAGLSLANGCFGLFILPESLPAERRTRFSFRRANPLGAIGLLVQRPLRPIAAAYFLSQLAHVVLPSVFVLYAQYRYGWGEGMVGATLAIVGGATAFVQWVLLPRAVRRLGERRMLLIGLGCGAASFAIYGLADAPWMFWLGIPVMALWGLAQPAIQSLMTARVDATQQGRLQGALSSAMGVAGLVGPALFTISFATFIGEDAPAHLPGMPFLVASALMVVALMVGTRIGAGTRA